MKNIAVFLAGTGMGLISGYFFGAIDQYNLLCKWCENRRGS